MTALQAQIAKIRTNHNSINPNLPPLNKSHKEEEPHEKFELNQQNAI